MINLNEQFEDEDEDGVLSDSGYTIADTTDFTKPRLEDIRRIARPPSELAPDLSNDLRPLEWSDEDEMYPLHCRRMERARRTIAIAAANESAFSYHGRNWFREDAFRSQARIT